MNESTGMGHHPVLKGAIHRVVEWSSDFGELLGCGRGVDQLSCVSCCMNAFVVSDDFCWLSSGL